MSIAFCNTSFALHKKIEFSKMNPYDNNNSLFDVVIIDSACACKIRL